MRHRSLFFAAAALAVSPWATAQPLFTDFLAPPLPGATATDGWFNLNSTAFPGYGTFGTSTLAWPAPIGSNQAGSGDAVLGKVAGTSGYLGGVTTNAIYSPLGAPTAGAFIISDATPLTGLQTLALQISTTSPLGPGAARLDYNGGTQGLAPDLSGVIIADLITTPFGEATRYVWGFQWDLTGLGPITGFSLDWTNEGPNILTYGARLDQGTQHVGLVPEPASAALAIGLLGLLVAAGRRRRTEVRS